MLRKVTKVGLEELHYKSLGFCLKQISRYSHHDRSVFQCSVFLRVVVTKLIKPKERLSQAYR